VTGFEAVSLHLSGGTEESHEIQYPSRDLNQGPPEYEVGWYPIDPGFQISRELKLQRKRHFISLLRSNMILSLYSRKVTE
jgi:hypothetical protein